MNSRENLPMMLSANDIQTMGFTRTMAYNILNREDVPVVKIGSRKFIQSEKYREALKSARLVQSMNSAGGRCHDNARCESMWARMKEELFYSRNRKPDNYTAAELKTMIWRYYMSYWNNRRICSANGGLPSAVKRRRYYEELRSAA